MSQFCMVFELLPVPVLVMLMVLLPEPMPIKVVVLLLPTATTFLMVLLVAPSEPADCSQTTADEVPVLLLLIVRSRVAATAVSDPAFVPSIVTQSAPLRTKTALALEPKMVGDTPGPGLIVTVLVELDPPLALIVSGKVSPVAVE